VTRAGACLVAGCGDVGARLGVTLAARGEKVYGLRRSDAPLPAGMLPLRADLTDAATLRNLPDDIERVVFLPAPGARDAAAYRGLFVDGVANLADALAARARVERFVFVSSSAVYGEHGGDWVDETTPCAPLAFNGELLLEAESRLYESGLPAIVARVSGLYGPGRTRLVDQVAHGTARLPAGAAEYTNRIHVDDTAAALAHLLALAEPDDRYLVTDDHPATLAEVYGFIAERLGVPLPPQETAPSTRAVGNKRLSNRRLRASGFSLRYPEFRDGYATVLTPPTRPSQA
jgi:electron-transferring-flavoprotein dehydrogenase